MSLFGIFLTFCKFSLLCFGGGYMLIPLLTAEFVGNGKLLTAEQFGNLVSISQLTPGPVGINAATFTGFLQNGFSGALVATVGLVFPTLILATAAVSLIRAWKDHPVVQCIIYGARLGAAALVVYAVVIFAGLSVFSGPVVDFFRSGATRPGISLCGLLITAVTFVLILKFKLKITWVILLSGALGALLAPFWKIVIGF